MIEWYNALSTVQRIFALIAIPSTVVLLIQTILLLFGIGDGHDGSGADFHDIGGIHDIGHIPAGEHDVNTSHDVPGEGFTLFSVRGIMAMLCVGGWSGIALSEAGLGTGLSALLSAVIGFAALFGMALLVSLLLKLQSTGNIVLSNAVGKVGQVYIPIPPSSTGTGKVNITLQEKYTELSAMTGEDSVIKTGEMVRVVATDEVGIVMVERVKKEK